MKYIKVWNARYSFLRYSIKAIKFIKFRGLYWAMVGILDTGEGIYIYMVAHYNQ